MALKFPCPDCDGTGFWSQYDVKRRCREIVGHANRLPDGSLAYFTSDGKEMEIKTVGGWCPTCGGAKVVESAEANGQ